ncbi:MAG TPA: apolipoprotein N-acyltransferase [Nocardioides sp.]|jgi:apolipoprotein N-acyltransferase|nr:apolipoprotein N-acyltransferase [Nocardioides sp.]
MLARCLVAMGAGAVLALTFPPAHAFWLLPFAVAAFFVVTDGLPARRAWVPGLAFGATFQFVLLWWLHVVGTVPWLGLSFTQTLWYGVLGAAVVPLRRLPATPAWLAVAWVAMESLRCTWPAGGMPWGRLAYAVVDTPLAPALPYLGSTGLSLVLALSGALLATAWERRGRRRLLPATALVAVLGVTALAGLAPYTADPAGEVTVAAVQGDVPGDGTDVLAHYRQITQQHADETARLAADVNAGRTPTPDFVVWPENSTAIDPFEDQQTRSDIESAVAAIDVPLLAGVIVDGGPDHVLNQGIVFDPVTGAGDRYTKWHPVPFGEYIPWRWLFGSRLAQLNQIPRDMVRGTRLTPIDVAGVPVADAICFDVAYDDGLYAQVSRGGRLMVVQTSNAMFIHTAQIDQQFAISRLRAVETHRYVVVAAINGITGVIAPDGSVVSSVPARTESYVASRVTLYDAVTPAVRAGAWTGRACLGLVVLGWLLGLGQYRRTRRTRRVAATSAPTEAPTEAPTGSPVDRTPA